jgi:NCAIR mutase (PurE)-related protein
MDRDSLLKLMHEFKEGCLSTEDFLKKINFLPFERISHHCIDHHRFLRKGLPEVIYGAGKTPKDIIEISINVLEKGVPLLVTRVSPKKAKKVISKINYINYKGDARCLHWYNPERVIPENFRGYVSIVTAGSSDKSVAEEAGLTLELIGCPVRKFYDIGVAGLHRLLHNIDEISCSKAVIVIAGMDGVLPSIVSGLLDLPIIAVPTSVGYGANLGGISPLLTMLNSCSPGISVVNIDNGFGAAVTAAYINKK